MSSKERRGTFRGERRTSPSPPAVAHVAPSEELPSICHQWDPALSVEDVQTRDARGTCGQTEHRRAQLKCASDGHGSASLDVAAAQLNESEKDHIQLREGEDGGVSELGRGIGTAGECKGGGGDTFVGSAKRSMAS